MHEPALSGEAAILRRAARAAHARKAKAHPLELPGQPWDRELLSWSKLYRRNRSLFLEAGGRFEASLVSSPRTLSSDILLEPRIEYSPIERELIWSATDPEQSRDPSRFLELRTYTSSLFHEQSHRILWKLLPPPPLPRERGTPPGEIRRYLHLAESLVIAGDMALADELGPERARFLYESGSIYNPGSHARRELGLAEYRRYLEVAMVVSYLLLELNEPNEIEPWLPALFPEVKPALRKRAWARASRIDVHFVRITNPFWQVKHGGGVAAALRRGRGRETPLYLPEDPSDPRALLEQVRMWFGALGLT